MYHLINRLILMLALLHASVQPALAQLASPSSAVRGAELNAGGAVGMRSGQGGAALGDVSGAIGAGPNRVVQSGSGNLRVEPGPWPVIAAAGGSGPPLTPPPTNTPQPGVPTATATSLPTVTSTTGGQPTFTDGPTVTPGGEPTATPTGGSLFTDFYARGDADCDLNLSAADVVAHLRGAGATVCGNDDCNRDGTVDVADATCGARCLFGDCPPLPGTPRVAEVAPDTAEQVVPLSFIRIRGSDLTSEEELLQVQIGGENAGIVEATEGELVVAVPILPPGVVDLVVQSGEKASRRIPIEIAAPSPIGAADGLADLLDLAEDVTDQFAALDLEEEYGAEGAALIRSLGDQVHAETGLLRQEGLAPLPQEVREPLDGFVDGGGVVDAMREALAELEGSALHGGGAGLTRADAVRRVATQIYIATIELTKKYSAAKLKDIALREAITRQNTLGRFATRWSLVLLAWIAAVIVLLDLPELAGLPIPVGTLDAPAITFEDAGFEERGYPTAGGRMRIKGCRIGRLTTGVDLKLANGKTVPLEVASSCSDTEGLDVCPFAIPPFQNGCLEFRLPDTVGFCGRVGFNLYNEVLFRIPFGEIGLDVQPEILDGNLRYSGVLNYPVLQVRGVSPCTHSVFLDGPRPSERRHDVGAARSEGGDPETIVGTPYARRTSLQGGCFQAEVAPGPYDVSVAVGDVFSEEEEAVRIEVESRVRRLQVECNPRVIRVRNLSSNETPSLAQCTFSAWGLDLRDSPWHILCFPEGTERVQAFVEGDSASFPSGPPGTITLDTVSMNPSSYEEFTTTVSGDQPGTATVTGKLFLEGDVVLAETETGFDVEVRDLDGPAVVSVSPCDGTVNAGDTLRLRVDALDNFLVSRIGVSLPPAASPDPSAEFPCILDVSPDVCPFPLTHCDACGYDFEIPLNENLPAGPLTVDIKATDGGGNESTTQCTFNVRGLDQTPPVLSGSPCSGTVRAGETLRIDVEATDETAMDRLTAAVPAGVALDPSREFACPPESMSCVQTFNFVLSSSLDVGDVRIDLEAYDVNGNVVAQQCVFHVEGAPELAVEPCGGTVQPGARIRMRVETRDDRRMERIEVTVPANVTDEPLQQAGCSFNACNANFEIPTHDPLGVDGVDVEVEAFDADGNRTVRVCSYDVVRPPSVTYRKIVDTSTPVPVSGVDATFRNFGDWVISQGQVAFSAVFRPTVNGNPTFNPGLFVWNGASLVTVADGNTLVPGTNATKKFRSYPDISMSGDEIAFKGDFDHRYDLFRIRIGADPVNGVERVIAFSELQPPPITTFFLRNGYAAGWFFQGAGTQPTIYLASLPSSPAAVEMIGGPTVDIPMGTGKFTNVASPAALDVDSGGRLVAFRGFGAGNQQGIYLKPSGEPIERIADRTTRRPLSDGVFNSFCGEAVDGTEVAFQGSSGGGLGAGDGVYIRRNGVLEKIADRLTDVPGGAGVFEEIFCSVGLDDGIVVFKSEEPDGLFAHVDGALTRIVAVGDSFDGGVVTGVLPRGEDGIDGNQLVVFVQVRHGDEFPVSGLWLATIERDAP